MRNKQGLLNMLLILFYCTYPISPFWKLSNIER